MARLLRVSDLPEGLTPHSLRHTHTSLLAEAGVGLEENYETARAHRRRHYPQGIPDVTKQMKKEAAKKFDNLMDNL